MSITVINPDVKATALGGVATGNMKANCVPIVTGSMRYRGLTFRFSAWKQGKNTCIN